MNPPEETEHTTLHDTAKTAEIQLRNAIDNDRTDTVRLLIANGATITYNMLHNAPSLEMKNLLLMAAVRTKMKKSDDISAILWRSAL